LIGVDKGASIISRAVYASEINFALAEGIDCKVRNTDGYNELEEVARRCDDPAATALLVAMSDEDFIENANKFIRGALCYDADDGNDPNFDSFGLGKYWTGYFLRRKSRSYLFMPVRLSFVLMSMETSL